MPATPATSTKISPSTATTVDSPDVAMACSGLGVSTAPLARIGAHGPGTGVRRHHGANVAGRR